MAAHTPGPWRVGEKRHDYADIVIRVIRNRENHPVTMTCYAGYTRRTGDANARLVAAAPELLAALEQTITRFERCMVQAGSDPTYAHEATRDARSAIAKARGQ